MKLKRAFELTFSLSILCLLGHFTVSYATEPNPQAPQIVVTPPDSEPAHTGGRKPHTTGHLKLPPVDRVTGKVLSKESLAAKKAEETKAAHYHHSHGLVGNFGGVKVPRAVRISRPKSSLTKPLSE